MLTHQSKLKFVGLEWLVNRFKPRTKPDTTGLSLSEENDVLSKRDLLTRIAVVLGDNPDDDRKIASFLSNQARMLGYENVEIVQVADLSHALKFWEGSGYNRVGFVVPEVSDFKTLSDIVRRADSDGFTKVYSQQSLVTGGMLNENSLTDLFSVIGDHAREQTPDTHTLPSTETLEIALQRTSRELYQRWTTEKVSLPSKRFRVSHERGAIPYTRISEESLEVAVEKIRRLLPAPSLSSSPVSVPNDSRNVNGELGDLLRTLVYSEGGGTRFKSHATEGIIGLFPGNKSFEAEEKFFWLKVYKSTEEVDREFRRYDDFMDLGIEMEHEPLVVTQIDKESYVILSSARILTLTGDIVQTLRRDDHEFAKSFVHQKTIAGIERRVYNRNAQKIDYFNASERAQVMQGYQDKAWGAWYDIHLAAGADPDPAREQLFRFALELYDYTESNWPEDGFVSIEDWKPFNDGHPIGTRDPDASQLKEYFTANSGVGRFSQKLNRRIKATQRLLEYGNNDGFILEDLTGHVGSFEMGITNTEKPQFFKHFLGRLFNERTPTPERASMWWHSYFAMDFYKSLRKIQRTLQYIVNDDVENPSYVSELDHYRSQMVIVAQTAYAYFSHPLSLGIDFQKQLTVVGQLSATLDLEQQVRVSPTTVNLERWQAASDSAVYLSSLRQDPDILDTLEITR